MSTYRENAAPEAKSGELLFTPKAAQADAEKAWFAGTGLVALPLVLGIGLAQVNPWGGYVGFGIGAACSLLWRKYRNDPVVLRVDGGRFTVGHVRKKAVAFDVALADLLDVRLETKEVRRLQEGPHAVVGVRYEDSRTVTSTEHGRLVLVHLAGGRKVEHPLMKDFVAHMEATEWLSKVRVFLRKHGWTPADEREDLAPESEMPPSSLG